MGSGPGVGGYAIWVSTGVLRAGFSSPIVFGQSLRPIQWLFPGLLVVAIIGQKPLVIPGTS
jgi:multidrug transporter EmrE-like cation transporter